MVYKNYCLSKVLRLLEMEFETLKASNNEDSVFIHNYPYFWKTDNKDGLTFWKCELKRLQRIYSNQWAARAQLISTQRSTAKRDWLLISSFYLITLAISHLLHHQIHIKINTLFLILFLLITNHKKVKISFCWTFFNISKFELA